MNLEQIKKDPHFCKKCMRITQFVFQVAKNTLKGQYTGYVCPECNTFKGVKFTPYRSRNDYERIYEKNFKV